MKKLSKRRLSELERKSENSDRRIDIYIIRTYKTVGDYAIKELNLPSSVWIIRTRQGMNIEDYPNREAFYLAVKIEMERVYGEPWNHDLER